jgi:cardiolipin synthase
MRHLPNLICLLRIALVWPLIQSLLAHDYRTAFWVFVLAAVSDGLDGYLAKRFAWTSDLGRVLDPVADKLLLVSLFLLATWLGLVPRWLTIMAVARDVMIGFGALTFIVIWGPLRGRPMLISKLNTLLQLLYMLAMLASHGYQFPPAVVVDALAVLTGLTVLCSGFAYFREFAARAWRAATSG